MDDWFNVIAEVYALSSETAEELNATGFIIVPGPVIQPDLSEFAIYDAAVLGAHPNDVSIGRSTTRVNDFVNRGPDFDGLYVYGPVLASCCSVIGQSFKLSTMHARPVHPRSLAQALHVDFRRGGDGWPMVGFILMIDEFRRNNGATRFVPGSHLWPQVPGDVMQDPATNYDGQVSVCGPAGSLVIYNGSVWHGHAPNETGQPRRSIQGAYIRRDEKSAVNQAACIRPATLARISALAKYVLAV